jgi:hypothetical protein
MFFLLWGGGFFVSPVYKKHPTSNQADFSAVTEECTASWNGYIPTVQIRDSWSLFSFCPYPSITTRIYTCHDPQSSMTHGSSENQKLKIRHKNKESLSITWQGWRVWWCWWSQHVDGFQRRSTAQGGMCDKDNRYGGRWCVGLLLLCGRSHTKTML